MRLGKSSVSPVIGAVLKTSMECRYPDRGFVVLAVGHRSGLDTYTGVIPRMLADQNGDLLWNRGALTPP
jgi:hypothetical protein